MAQHNRRCRPRDPIARQHAEQRESQLIAQLMHQAREVQELQRVADEANEKLRRRAIKLAQERELDITDIHKATGISRDAIHRQLRQQPPEAKTSTTPTEGSPYRVGQQVLHPGLGTGAVERIEWPTLFIRFAREPERTIELHGRLATLSAVDPGDAI